MKEHEELALKAINELITTEQRSISKAPHRVREIIHTLAAAFAVKDSILASAAVPKKAPAKSKENK
jgi:vacuolar-type H+-ATPase subunit H